MVDMDGKMKRVVTVSRLQLRFGCHHRCLLVSNAWCQTSSDGFELGMSRCRRKFRNFNITQIVGTPRIRRSP
jgi:hypothetical protein